MHLSGVKISKLRSIRELEWVFPAGREAGWHVVLGNNGTGKSTVLRGLAFALLDKHFAELRQPWSTWPTSGQQWAEVQLWPRGADAYTGIKVSSSSILMSMELPDSQLDGRFSLGFGPYRQFGRVPLAARERSRTSVDRLLSLFGENNLLADTLDWLVELRILALTEPDAPHIDLLNQIRSFVNDSQLLPYGTHMAPLSPREPNRVTFVDGNGVVVDISYLGDGYRSALAIVFELIRRVIEHFEPDQIWAEVDGKQRIIAPGVVLIDEADAHLHPSWQRNIGYWLTDWFPNMQFIVTTHSPLVCQAAERGSILRLPDPGSSDAPYVVEGLERDRLLYGNILDAYATPSFGRVPTRSRAGDAKLARLAELNQKSHAEGLSEDELDERESLLRILPTRREHSVDAAE